jgi:alpha,alpha-trehalase
MDRYQAVILDMDGVITRSARVHAAAWKRMFDGYLGERAAREGGEYEPFDAEEDYHRYVDGKPRYEGARSFLESRQISLPYGDPDDPPDRETVCGLGNRKNQYFLQHLREHGVEVYESSKEFVKEMKARNKRVAVISSSRNAKAVLEAAGARELFQVVIDGVEASKLRLEGKPEPDVFLEAARQLDVSPDDAVVIEDAISGVKAGKAGGFALVIGIDRSGHNPELESQGADIVVSDLSELGTETRAVRAHTHDLASALEKIEEIIDRLHSGRPAIFLDYDGTLTPIVEDPSEAKLPDRTRELLGKLSEHWTVVIMSGRALDDVRDLVGLENLVYAGCHGFNIAGPEDSFHDKPGDRFVAALDRAEQELGSAVQSLSRVRLERKPFAITIHFRQADRKTVSELRKRAEEVTAHHPDLERTSGKKTFELRPKTEWDKGRALLDLLEKLHIDSSRTVPLYVGADATDEKAFRVISDRGIGIRVGGEDQPTAAHYALQDTGEVATLLEQLMKLADKESSVNVWSLVYEGFEPESEKHREALCTLGNGYFAARGAAPESSAGRVHYPGTYVAGLYNRLESTIAGRTIENESMVNIPNWLPLGFRVEEGDWFDPESVNILRYRQQLDMKRGILVRSVYFEDPKKRRTEVTQRRFVHMSYRHLAGLETTILPENWSGTIRVRSALDGRVENTLVERYRQLNNHHLAQLGSGVADGRSIWLQVETNQSHIRIAEAARTTVFEKDTPVDVPRQTVQEEGYIGEELEIEVRAGEKTRVEKIVSVYSSRDRAVSESLLEAQAALRHAGSFAALLRRHTISWSHLWKRWHIKVEAQSPRVEQVLNLHIFHLLQTVSPNTIHLDVGVPPRGLHGEAYRGLIMWDELFIFPLLNLRMPDITRALLMYRHSRLTRARWASRQAGYGGAMFPWQSGSNGEEQAQTLHLNPNSGNWIPDNSQLQRHINIAIAYNIWQYYQVTADEDFMSFYGAELMILIARFWAAKAQYNRSLERYEICRVMGPDEFHDAYPDAPEPGIDNSAYTNVMAAWILWRVLDVLDRLPRQRRDSVMESLAVRREEIEHWDEVGRKLRVPFHGGGIISQFEGYDELEEFGWESYRKRYGNIQRLDRILESEGDSPNRYKLSKQADVLMLFYLLSADELGELFERLGYSFEPETIPDNIEYYLQRTSHGSTLSRVVHAWVLSRSKREMSWRLFQDALESDIEDIQGGTTREGIHLGAMAGTVDLILRCYSGIESRGDVLWFNPSLPSELKSMDFSIRYRRSPIDVNINASRMTLHRGTDGKAPVKIGFADETFLLAAGETRELDLSRLESPETGG